MQLQGRNLSMDMQPRTGEDVRLLHTELRALGFPIPEEESRDAIFGDGTRSAVIKFQESKRLGPTGVVNEDLARLINADFDALPPQPKQLIVRGQVVGEDGISLDGIEVNVFDRDIGEVRQRLGDPAHRYITKARDHADDGGGRFEVPYTAEQFTRGEGRKHTGADLVFALSTAEDHQNVEVVALYRLPDGGSITQEQKVEDPVLGIPARDVEEVRIVVKAQDSLRAPSEYERLMAELAPVLLDKTPADLDEEKHRDISFVVRETQQDRTLVETLSVAWKFAQQTHIAAPVFYGLLRDGPPTQEPGLPFQLSDVLEAGKAVWERKLKESLALNIIPVNLGQELADHLRLLRDLRVEQAGEPVSEGRASIHEVLSMAQLTERAQREFLTLYYDHDGAIEDFWNKVVPEQLGWQPEQIRRVQTALQFAELTTWHLPLVKLMQSREQLRTMRDLAKLDPAVWQEMIHAAGVPPNTSGEDAPAREASYLRHITDVLQATHPTQFVARIAAKTNDDALIPARDLLQQFFDRETEQSDAAQNFDMRTHPVSDYLEQHGERISSGLTGEQQTLLTHQLKRLQRTFQLSTNPEQMQVLLENKLDSAAHVVRLSPEKFVELYAVKLGGETEAGAVYSKAEQIHGALLRVAIDSWKVVNDATPRALRSPGVLLEKIKVAPAYTTLFGSLELCECEHCQSVYSPAAYFVDLLHFLDIAPKNPDGLSPLDILIGNVPREIIGRRPDLAYIQLTCANTNTLIPYADLVNEILESFVANERPMPFNQPPAAPNNILPSPTAVELSANPVYLTAASEQAASVAYTKLQQATHPLTLPFNLPLNVMRTYLEHLGTSREDVLRLFHQEKVLEDLDVLMAIAAETLHLSPEEFELLTDTRFSGAASTPAITLARKYGFTETGLRSAFNHVSPELRTGDPRTLAVKALQNLLKNLLGISPTLKITGAFDTPTEQAVNDYYQRKGLPTSGVANDAFWAAVAGDGVTTASHSSLAVFMSYVPILLERAGLTYLELVDLIQTRLLNPQLQDLEFLKQLNISPEEVNACIKSNFSPLPPSVVTKLTAANVSVGDFTRWVNDHRKVLVLNTPPENDCALDEAVVMHLDGTLLSPQELNTLHRLVRLWRKLGWTLREVDRAVSLFSGSTQQHELVLRLADIKTLSATLRIPREELLCLWAPVDTWGTSSLYDRLFLSVAAQKLDAAFALNLTRSELKAVEVNPNAPPHLADHLPVLLAALRISASDLALLREATGLTDQPNATPPFAVLNLVNLSTLYRHVLLAKALRLSVQDFLALCGLSGIDPFAPPFAHPQSAASLFVDVTDRVRKSEHTVAQLNYLFRHVVTAPNDRAVLQAGWLSMTGTLLTAFARIAQDTQPVDDPTGEILTTRLSPVLDPTTAQELVRIVYGTAEYTTALDGLPDNQQFPPSVGRKIGFDKAKALLRYTGAMTPAEKADLEASAFVNTLPVATRPKYLAAVDELFKQPATFMQEKLRALLDPVEAEPILRNVPSLDAQGKPVLVDAQGNPLTTGGTQAAVTAIAMKSAYLLQQLRRVLSQNLIKQTLSDAFKLDTATVALLLEHAPVLHALSDATAPTMRDFLFLSGDGLRGTYFNSEDLSGTPVLERLDGSVDFAWGTNAPATGVNPDSFSVRWVGKVFVETSEEYTFSVRASDGVRLTLDGNVLIDEWRTQPVQEFKAVRKLEAGRFYDLVLEYFEHDNEAVAQLRWSSPAKPQSVIPPQQLYSPQRVQEILARVERLYKVGLIITTATLSASEVAFLVTRKYLDLNALPMVLMTPAQAKPLFEQWLRVQDYVTLRSKLPAVKRTLLDVLSAPSPEAAIDRFVQLSGWQVADLRALYTGFTFERFNPQTMTWDAPQLPDLRDDRWWLRLVQCHALVRRTGASPRQLFEWARVKHENKTPTGPVFLRYTMTAADAVSAAEAQGVAQDVKNVVKAKYNDEQWPVVAKSLNDTLRAKQKAALIAYILAMPRMQEQSITHSNQLFEYFLIDVEMDPCMQTSRIKQGIASVQLFIQRCLMNLEKQVSPAQIDEHRWRWMRRYRVWEANRKVFLYPENWIEPELRDDKSPFFKELESEVLQNELTEANAEKAFLHYLQKLDDVAKLDICGVCQDTENKVLHVFARTFTTPYVYYYRRLEQRAATSWAEGIWTPWEKVPVDIASVEDGENSGVHLIPVLWNRRLYLFWPIFAQKPNEEQNKKLPEGFDPLNDWEIKLAWSEYWQGKWSTKTESNAFVMSPCVVASILTNEKQPPKGKTDVGVFIYTTVFLGGVPPEPGLMRDGEKLNPNETAQFFSQETLNRIEYYLPTPKDHFFTVGYNNERLLISVHRRFSAEATGRETVKQYESVSIVRDGKGELRERTKENPPRNYPGAHVESFDSLRLFALESCNGKVTPLMWLVSGPYNAIVTPPDTQNTFMAFADIQAANFSLPDKQPLLQNKPSPFSVIDSDNRADFNPYNGFFYLDDACAYFVTSRVGSNDYFRPFTTPDVTTPKFSLPGLQRDYDLFRDLPYPQPLSPSINPIETNPWFLTSRRVFAPQTELAQMPGIDLAPLRPGVTLTPDRASDGKVRGVHQRAKISLIYQFHKHWHPHVCEFIRGLNRDGFAGLLTVKTQGLSNDVGGSNHFQQVYRPSRNVAFPYPSEDVDFRRSGAYSLYNWELFFHVPFLLATRLSRQQRFEEALRWFHYIFNPMDSGDDSPTPPEPAPQRYWKFLPFKAVDAQRIDELLGLLSYQGSDPDKLSEKQSLEAAIQEWAADPFKPHLIARTRHIAYMKSVFMKYVDTLIAWGDQLFRQDTIESINEATQLYVLAANLLGERPQRIPKHGNIQPETYDSLRKRKLDALANAMVELETRLPFAHLTPAKNGVTGQLASAAQTLYFCIPQNDKLLSYWDTVADRLFKIRHCMNIEGVVRQLPLFEPPIDPALLVQAVAMGLDLTSVLNDLYAPLPHYRFTYMLQKALELAAELRSLGSALLSTLEKKDAEALAKLRARHETEMLNLVKEVKKKQKEETQANLTALRRTRAVADVRYQHYQKLLGAQTVSAPPENSAVPLLSNDANKIAEDSSTYKLIESERQHLERLERANERQEDATYIEVAAGLSHLLPNITIKKGIFEWTFGGSNIGSALGAWARYVSHLAADYTHQANRASIIGGVERRMEDWVLQSNLAAKEIEQIDKQIIAARIREDIAQKELTNHDEQLTRAQKIEEFLRSTKYTNEDLYVWMEGRIAEVYFQCYEMTHDFVKRTEQAFRFVLGVTTSNYIKFDYWDSLKKGLMVGESLYLALKQMENAYHDQNKREYEITKHVSLLQLDPLALIQLKETGQCEIELPEVLFDLDFPGHYFRRIKSVSITIPCVVGPYSSVNCTLTLLSNRTRVNSVVTDAYSETPDGNDGRFVRDFAAMQSIATSHAQNDSGMFELNFRDERYLPFEGAGAISRWRIELPREFRQFDYDTISDVVLHLKYTARDGGKALADAALEEMRADLNTLMTTARNGEGFVRLFSARHEFPNEWYRFLNPTDLAAQQQILEFALEKDRFPLLFSNERFTITLRDIQLFLKLKGGFSYEDTATLVFNKDSNPQSPPKFTITDSPIGTEDSKLPFAIFPGISDQSPLPQQLKLEVRSTDLPIPSTASETSWWKVVQVNNQNQSRLKAEAFEDIFVVCHYSVAPKQ